MVTHERRAGRTRANLAALCVLAVFGQLLAGCARSTEPAAGPAIESAAESAPPNFVILIADDLGWQDLGAYGSQFAYTPNIDKLAEEGLRFTHFFLTTSSCSPSRASILTGKYPQTNGLVRLHQALPEDQPLVTNPLRERGYYTASIGKWHIGGKAKKHFDMVLEDHNGSGSGQWQRTLRERPKDRPFFFWLASVDPHRPHNTGAAFAGDYRDRPLALPANFAQGEGVRRELERYFQEVSQFDSDVGAVMQELEDQGVLSNTVVIVMSDNGRPFHLAKTLLTDDGIRSPFILYWPEGVARPGDFHGLVSAIDLAPTVLSLAGVAQPAGMQGRSFHHVLQDPGGQFRDHVFAVRNWHARNAHERAVRTGSHLYKENQYPRHGDCVDSVYRTSPSFQALAAAHARGETAATVAECFEERRPDVELFEIAKDGSRSINLADQPEYLPIRNRLADLLSSWREETGDFDYVPYEPATKQ